MSLAWKPNWTETRQHLTDWWHHQGLAVGWHLWGLDRSRAVHGDLPQPAMVASPEQFYTDACWRAQHNHYELSRLPFPHDCMPISETDIGPGSLALFLGCEPGFEWHTVWYKPCWQKHADVESLPPLAFDPNNHWWKVTESVLRECVKLSKGNYMVGCPDLIENIDILASLREAQELMMDMIERPDWVHQKLREINQVWFEAFQRIYDIIKLDDGSSAFCAFRLWGPGKTAKVQCDASAMFSADMFREFVVPTLTEQCAWLDYSMYHLDGTQAMQHLPLLLEIEELDAIEWTPQSGIPSGGNAQWYDMYRQIKAAGKSVQAIRVKLDEIEPLIEAVGPEGLYILVEVPCKMPFDAFLAELDKRVPRGDGIG